jgi:DNA (cytosine-5)-methyltransferase 1
MTSSTSPASSAILENLTDITVRRFMYDSANGSFTEIPRERLQRGPSGLPPDHCPVCTIVVEREEELVPQKIHHGVSLNGIKYHVHDTVMIKAQEGPCHIGQIFRIHFEQSDDEDSVLVRVKLLGRIDKLGLRPAEEPKDEVRIQNSHASLILI